MLNYPERVATAGILFYLGLWLIAPLEVVFPISWSAMGFIVLCYAAFFMGIALAAVMPKTKVLGCPANIHSGGSGGFWFFALLGATGMALRVYDKLFVRGASLAETALESREMLADVTAGPLSVVGGALYPFCYIPLILWLSNKHLERQSLLKAGVAFLLFLLPALDALLLLSRSQLLVAISMMYVSVACAVFRGNPFDRRLIVPATSGLVIVLVISIVTFFGRVDLMGLDVLLSIFDSSYGYTITPNLDARLWLESQSWLSVFSQSVLPIIQYYLHGIFEFGLLWDRPDEQIFTLGGQIFSPYVKLLGMLGIVGRDAIDYEAAYSRIGVFTTFFGPLWSDFGWFGLVFMFILGFVMKILSRQSMAGDIAVFPIYAFCVVVIFFMPVVNFFVSAQGMYVVNAFLVYGLYARYLKSMTITGLKDQRRRVF